MKGRMSRKSINKGVRAVLILSIGVALGGCQTTYMKNRTRDLAEAFDVGIVYNTSWKPNFEMYFDTLSTPFALGFGWVEDAKMIGMANGHYGIMDKNAKELGLMAWGIEKRGVGPFDPTNIYHAGERYKDETDWPTLTHGWYGSKWGSRPIPTWQFGQCSRGIHLGWLGFEMSNRITELVDFLAGVMTFDPMKDDLKDTRDPEIGA
jgi:hypothetical protein